MKKTFKRLSIFAVTVLMTAVMCISVQANTQSSNVTILFTHDLHSHFLPSVNADGGEYGGYARIMTAINRQKETSPNAILVDGGDFSMGSLFQTAYTTSALELKIMGQMGYDITTFGNHEFDYLPQGLAKMLDAAASADTPLPQIVNANYLPAAEGEDGYNENSALLQDAFDSFGVKEYTVIEKGGVYFAVFGITGIDSDDCAPNSNLVLHPAAEKAQEVVDKAMDYVQTKYNATPVLICLSHSGTSGEGGEDVELAKAVNGIDVIISGHSHTTLKAPVIVNDTYIVSAGEYGKNLGAISFEKSADGLKFAGYDIIAIDETIPEDETVAALIESAKKDVEKAYLGRYGLTFDQVLINNQYTFESVRSVYATQHESPLCNVYSDAYKWAAEKALGKKVDLALTASGVVRESLPTGDVTVSDVFNAASLGVGTEGELLSVYLSGKELKTVMEIDASVQPLMKAAQLFCSGVEYSFNTNRMIFNKVDYAMLRNDDGSLAEIEDDKLYNVVTGMYCGGMLGSVKESSFGLLSLVPKDENGNPIDMSNLAAYVIKDENGNPVKEWYAIASYLQQMGGKMDEKYAGTDGRKIVYSSLSPAALLRNANKFTYILLGVVAVIILIAVVVVRLVILHRRKRKSSK